jgi:hypothetical protein
MNQGVLINIALPIIKLLWYQGRRANTHEFINIHTRYINYNIIFQKNYATSVIVKKISSDRPKVPLRPL